MNASMHTQEGDLKALAQKVLDLDRRELSPCDEPYLMALVELGDQAQQIISAQVVLHGLKQLIKALDHRYSHFEVHGCECDEEYRKLKEAISHFIKTGLISNDVLVMVDDGRPMSST